MSTLYDVGLSAESWGKGEEGGMFITFSFQVIVTLNEMPTFLEMFKHLSAIGRGV